MPPTLCWQQFPSMEIHFRDVFWLHNFIHGNCTAEVSINSCLFFFNQQITMSFFVDSIFSPIEISRQRFTSNPALEVLFCKSTKSIQINVCKKHLHINQLYFGFLIFFCKIFFQNNFPFLCTFWWKNWVVSGAYQSRIRAVSEPYQGKTEHFHFFLGDWIFFGFSRCSALFLPACHEGSKKNTCHCQTLNSFQQSKSV